MELRFLSWTLLYSPLLGTVLWVIAISCPGGVHAEPFQLELFQFWSQCHCLSRGTGHLVHLQVPLKSLWLKHTQTTSKYLCQIWKFTVRSSTKTSIERSLTKGGRRLVELAPGASEKGTWRTQVLWDSNAMKIPCAISFVKKIKGTYEGLVQWWWQEWGFPVRDLWQLGRVLAMSCICYICIHSQKPPAKFFFDEVKSAIPRQCSNPAPGGRIWCKLDLVWISKCLHYACKLTVWCLISGAVDVSLQKLLFSRWSNLKEVHNAEIHGRWQQTFCWCYDANVGWRAQVFRDFYKLPEASAPTGMRGMLKMLRQRLFWIVSTFPCQKVAIFMT